MWSEDWSSGKGSGGKGGHAIVEPKYLSRVKDFLGDERSWKDWFASLTTAVIQMYPHLADAMRGEHSSIQVARRGLCC